jgi:hypothetical protein
MIVARKFENHECSIGYCTVFRISLPPIHDVPYKTEIKIVVFPRKLVVVMQPE